MAGALRDFFNLNKSKGPKEAYWTCPKCKTQNSLSSPFCVKCAADTEQPKAAEVKREKVTLETDNNRLTAALVQMLNLYLQTGQMPSREVAAEAEKMGIHINAPQEIALVPVKQLDQLADRFADSHRIMATGSGAVLGLPGGLALLATIPTDVSALTWFSFRTISGIAQTYGSETRSEEGRTIALLIFAGALGMDKVTVAGSEVFLSSLTKNVLTKPYRDLIIKQVVPQVAKWIGLGLAERGLGRAIPLFGGVVGATSNYLFMSNLSTRTKTYYRTRLLEQRNNPQNLGDDNPI